MRKVNSCRFACSSTRVLFRNVAMSDNVAGKKCRNCLSSLIARVYRMLISVQVVVVVVVYMLISSKFPVCA